MGKTVILAVPSSPKRTIRQSLAQPRVALPLLCLAALVWGGIFFWQRHSGPAQAHLDTGRTYASNLQYGMAEREWQTAVRLDPHNAQAWELLGKLYLTEHSWQAAADAFGHLQKLAPNTDGLNDCLASANLHTGNTTAAIQYAREALKHNPNDLPALLIACPLLDKMGGFQEELNDMRRLVALQPDSADYQGRLADLLTKTYQYQEARPLLEQIVRQNPNDSKSWQMLGMGWLDTDSSPNGLAQAEADFRQAASLVPEDANVHYNLGRLYLRRHQYPSAAAELEQATRLNPKMPEFWYDLSNAYSLSGNARKAAVARQRFSAMQSALDQAKALKMRCVTDPDNYTLHLQTAIQLMRTGDYPEAPYYLRRIRQMRPSDPRTAAAFRQFSSQAPANIKSAVDGSPQNVGTSQL